MKPSFVFVFLFLCVSLWGAEFNMELRSLMRRSDSSLSVSPWAAAQFTSSLPSEVLVFGEGDPSDLTSRGGKVQTRAATYFTALVPVSQLKNIENSTSLKRLSYLPAVKPLMDLARGCVGVSTPEGVGYTGSGVIVGIVDTGIDWSHPDFKTDQGLSRILYIWDQSVKSVYIPANFDYGHEWTKYQIDQGLCEEADKDSHGTHVSGIAAGNGSVSGGQYAGIAPDANIVFVKLNFSSMSYVLDAVEYIFQKADEQGKPCVVNLSLGTHAGTHTVNDPFNRAMDALVEKYGAAGHIVVWAAGNEGSSALHTKEKLSSSSTTTIPFTRQTGDLLLHFYLPGTNNSTFRVFQSSSDVFGQINLFHKTNVVNSSTEMAVEFLGSDTLISIYFGSSVDSSTSCEIRFSIMSVPVVVDGYIINYTDDFNQIHGRFDNPVYSNTISTLACQRDSLAIGCITTKTNWTDYTGHSWIESTLTSLYTRSAFSSMGPDRDDENKPDFSAPGAMIVSTASKNGSYYQSEVVTYSNSLPYYVVKEGTSMAAPVATGVIALLLEKEPYLTADSVRTRLQSVTGTSWNNGTGYGTVSLTNYTSNNASTAQISVSIRNNVLSFGGSVDNRFVLSVRCNSTDIGKSLSFQIIDRFGNLIRDFGTRAVTGIEVTDYEWDGIDQFGRTVKPGVYFALVGLDGAVARYPVLVVR